MIKMDGNGLWIVSVPAARKYATTGVQTADAMK